MVHDQVAERTAGRVKFQYYPAEQLGKVKDMLSLTQTGVADIAYVALSFITRKQGAREAPAFMPRSGCARPLRTSDSRGDRICRDRQGAHRGGNVGLGKIWAMELDQRGKPGTRILDAFEKALH
jgi:hypothetical protein